MLMTSLRTACDDIPSNPFWQLSMNFVCNILKILDLTGSPLHLNTCQFYLHGLMVMHRDNFTSACGLFLVCKFLMTERLLLLTKSLHLLFIVHWCVSMHCRHDASTWQLTLPHVVPTDAIPPCNMRHTYWWFPASHHEEYSLHIACAWHIIVLTLHLMFTFWSLLI